LVKFEKSFLINPWGFSIKLQKYVFSVSTIKKAKIERSIFAFLIELSLIFFTMLLEASRAGQFHIANPS